MASQATSRSTRGRRAATKNVSYVEPDISEDVPTGSASDGDVRMSGVVDTPPDRSTFPSINDNSDSDADDYAKDNSASDLEDDEITKEDELMDDESVKEEPADTDEDDLMEDELMEQKSADNVEDQPMDNEVVEEEPADNVVYYHSDDEGLDEKKIEAEIREHKKMRFVVKKYNHEDFEKLSRMVPESNNSSATASSLEDFSNSNPLTAATRPKESRAEKAENTARNKAVKAEIALAKKAATAARKAEEVKVKAEEKAAVNVAKAEAKAANPTGKKTRPAKKGPAPKQSPGPKKISLDGEEDLADDEEDEEEQEIAPEHDHYTTTEVKKKKKHNFAPGYDDREAPLTTSDQMFGDLGRRLIKAGLEQLTSLMDGRALNVGTFCSGTEAPILAMRLLREFFLTKGITFNFNQIISAEIQPAKSAFIERNFSPSINARDITEILRQSETDPDWKTEWTFTTAYGGKADIPNNLDLLIAGFCCDDFSHLNSHRKNLNDKGESGDTFFAVLEYVNRYRPKMVVLENVLSAPWVDAKIRIKKTKRGDLVVGLDKHFQALGYVVSYMKLDTKNYYLPHTRQRGYMVCVQHYHTEDETDTVENLAAKFPEVVNGLKRAASAPMEALLLDFDSPLLDATSREEGGKQRTMPWDKCKLGHQKYVKDHGLGSRHPITFWDVNGYKVLPDYYKQTTLFTNRTTDFIDISHLRNISIKGIDDRYFNRFLELSQNVYRYEDTNRGGIVGCVTPNNFIFQTMRGSRLTGIESLIAQGYNPEAVDTMNMSDVLLNDMSGNAMTSTVVGTVIFAALISFKGVFDFAGRPKQIEEAEPHPGSLGKELLEAHKSHPAFYNPVSAKDITALAEQTVRMCICEGQLHVTSRQIQQCKVCRATSCVKCGHNPKHQYEELSIARKQPIEFESAIKNSLPFQIDLTAFKSEVTSKLLRDASKYLLPSLGWKRQEWTDVLEKVKLTLGSTVSFRTICRAHCWQISFESPDALLKLEVSSGGVEWLLYANIPDEPLVTKVGKYLRRFPFARMRPTGDDIMKGEWHFWNPKKSTLQTTITSSGPLEKSFENERGLVEFQTTFVYPNVSITSRGPYDPQHLDQDILGEYVRFSECGQAWNSVHARKSVDGQKPLLLFYNQHLHSGPTEDFFFSFTNDVARKRHAEPLSVVCNLPKSWRQFTVNATKTAAGLTIGGVPIESFTDAHSQDVDICLDGCWVPLSIQLKLHPENLINFRRLPAKIDHIPSSCGHKRAVFDMIAQLPHERPTACRLDRWTLINKANKTSFWKEFLCYFEKELVLDGHCESDRSWISYQDDLALCSSCAPPPPSMQWTFDKKPGLGYLKQVPVEDPEQASRHERAVKSRPSAVDVMYRINSTHVLELNISIDPATLMHRAAGSLLLNDTAGRTGTLVGKGIQTSYRLVTDQGKTATPATFQFTLRSTVDVVPLESLLDRKSPFTGYSEEPIPLYSAQARALTWMLNQECNPQPFAEQAVAETSVKEIGYRLEGRATREISVAGGILAQEVGFGKTILILSIIALHLKDVQKQVRESPNIEGAIRTQATLILVPPHLVGQWDTEAKMFVDKIHKNVLVIKNTTHLKALTVGEIKNAVIVIASWDLCSSKSYQEAYAQFSGNVPCADNATMRAQREWHKHSVTTFAANVETLKNNPNRPDEFKNVLKSQYDASVIETNLHDEYIPSKHVTGAKYQSALNKGPQPGDKRKIDDISSDDWHCVFDFNEMSNGKGIDGLHHPLIEMFLWARVVIDEHTYAKAISGLLLEFVKCSRLWLLSGTPRLGNFHDVKAMASLFGINLGCDDHSIMKPDVLKKKMSEFTASEKFAMYQESPTVAWQQTRMQHAQAFLDQFVRQDNVDLSHIEIEKRIIGVPQIRLEKAIYLELVQHVVTNDFQIIPLKAPTAAADNKAKHIQEASSEGEDGKRALFLQASSFDLKIDDLNNDDKLITASEMFQVIERTRTSEYSEMLDSFRSELKNAHEMSVRASISNKTCPEYNDWIPRACASHYGDHVTTLDIRSALDEFAKGDKASDKLHVIAALRTAASRLNTFCEQLVVRNRSLRVFKNVRRIQCAEILICSKCNKDAAASDITLLAGCGHLICCTCTISSDCEVVEGGDKCSAGIAFHQRVSCASLATESDLEETKFGSKIDYVVDLIQDKAQGYSIPPGEKILVFVQFLKVQKKLERAFKAAGIGYATLESRASSSTLKKFKQKGGARVLIMLTAAETAAGSNLTIAPNIIFFEPLYTDGSDARQEYDSAMTQAIGRSRRIGQEKTVKVYELLATKTIEVDYREHRGNCILQPLDTSNELGQIERPTPGAFGPLSSSIVHLTEFDG